MYNHIKITTDMNQTRANMKIRLEVRCEDLLVLQESLISSDNLIGDVNNALCEILQRHLGNIQPSCTRISLEYQKQKMVVAVVEAPSGNSEEFDLMRLI
jgi:hypothetical protein